MQAIVVKFLGPTNYRGSRYKASAQAGSIIVESDDRLNPEENARLACLALRKKLGWTEEVSKSYAGPWAMGYLPNGGCVFVNSFFGN